MIQEKQCTTCKKIKPSSDFGKDKRISHGLSSSCKTCINKKAREVCRTKSGLLSRIYNGQIYNSRQRGHTPPNYSISDFKNKFINDEAFCKLHNEWVESGYEKGMSPSFDRKDNSKGYSFDNGEWVTWAVNEDRARKDIISCKLKTSQKPVNGINIHTKEIVTFNSQSQAARELNIKSTHISKCCRYDQKTAGGYIWRFAITYNSEPLRPQNHTI